MILDLVLFISLWCVVDCCVAFGFGVRLGLGFGVFGLCFVVSLIVYLVF